MLTFFFVLATGLNSLSTIVTHSHILKSHIIRLLLPLEILVVSNTFTNFGKHSSCNEFSRFQN